MKTFHNEAWLVISNECRSSETRSEQKDNLQTKIEKDERYYTVLLSLCSGPAV
jgi:hypothetical protein